MTTEQIQTLISSGKATPGELWAAVQQYAAEQVSAVQAECDATMIALTVSHTAIDKAKLALEGKNPEAATEALALISVAKQTDTERKVLEIDNTIAKLEQQKAELLSP